MPNMPRQPKLTALNVDQHPVHNMIHVLMLMRKRCWHVVFSIDLQSAAVSEEPQSQQLSKHSSPVCSRVHYFCHLLLLTSTILVSTA